MRIQITPENLIRCIQSLSVIGEGRAAPEAMLPTVVGAPPQTSSIAVRPGLVGPDGKPLRFN